MPIRLLPLLAVLFMPLPATASDVPAATGLLRDEVFTGYSPLSRSSELVRRLLSPLNALRVGQEFGAALQAFDSGLVFAGAIGHGARHRFPPQTSGRPD